MEHAMRGVLFGGGDVAAMSQGFEPVVTAEPSRIAEALVSFRAPASLEADQYRALRYRIEERRRDHGFQVVAVTSPTPGDGKTVTALNLAGTLAQSAQARILVIDADFHQPTAAAYLGLTNPPDVGLIDAILNPETTLARVVFRVDALNLSLVLPGAHHGSAYELLTAPRFEALLQEARRSYDYIVIDTPPATVLPDAPLIGRWIDGYVLVVTAHKTPKQALIDAVEALDRSKIVGTVLNGGERRHNNYGNYDGYYRNAR
jgi:capsular exopolysaccharide synthesis family protein